MISYPFESLNVGTDEAPVYDRAITAENERMFNKLRYTTGVFNMPANGLQVSAAGGLQVKVSPGGCHIEGALGYLLEERALDISAAHATLARIDRVVARFNTSISDRKIDLFVLEGEPAATPVAPALTRESNYYELALADVRVAAGTTSVSNADIKDQRLSSDLCGLVVPAIPTPLSLDALYQEYEASLNKFLELVASALDGTTAGALQNQVDELEEKTRFYVTDDWAESRGSYIERTRLYSDGTGVCALEDANASFNINLHNAAAFGALYGAQGNYYVLSDLASEGVKVDENEPVTAELRIVRPAADTEDYSAPPIVVAETIVSEVSVLENGKTCFGLSYTILSPVEYQTSEGTTAQFTVRFNWTEV